MEDAGCASGGAAGFLTPVPVAGRFTDSSAGRVVERGQRSMFAALCMRELHTTQIRKRPYVADFCSSAGGAGCGVVGIIPPGAYSTVPPFAVRFAERPQHSHVCAVVDEDGNVTLVDTATPLPTAWEQRFDYTPSASWVAHHNAIFDVAWADDDRTLITASGDQKARVWDVATQAQLASLRGHAGSVKSVATRADAPWAVATGARDGCVYLWDTRAPLQPAQRARQAHLQPVGAIRGAHEPPKATGRGGRARNAPPGPRSSVTAVLFLRDGNALASGGTGDAAVRLWDARNMATPLLLAQAERGEGRAQRRRGITALAVDTDGGRLLAAYSDSTLAVFGASQPEAGPLARYGGHAAHSFYVKVAFSPDGTHLASGSCDKRVYVWQTDRPQDGPYALEGHAGEVTGVDWASGDFGRLASCADDGSLRVWSVKRPDVIQRRVLPRAPGRAIAPAPQRAAVAAAAAAAAAEPAEMRCGMDVDVAAAFATPAPPHELDDAPAAGTAAAEEPAAVLVQPADTDTPIQPQPAAMPPLQAPPPPPQAPPPPPPQEAPQTAAKSAAARSSQPQVTAFFSPVRPALLPADCNNGAGGSAAEPPSQSGKA